MINATKGKKKTIDLMTQEKPHDGGKNLRLTDVKSTFHYLSPNRGDILECYSYCRTITSEQTVKSKVNYKCFCKNKKYIASKLRADFVFANEGLILLI